MRFMRSYKAVIALVGVVGFAATASAAPDPGNPAILEAVQGVQSTVDAIATEVDALSAAAAPGNTRFTPQVLAYYPDFVYCTATNVSTAAKTIKIELLDGNTGTAIGPGNGPNGQNVAAGQSTVGSWAPGVLGIQVYCKFTVLTGNKTDIRAVFALNGGGPVSDKLVIAAE